LPSFVPITPETHTHTHTLSIYFAHYSVFCVCMTAGEF